MKIYLTGLVAAGFLATAVAQVNTQTSANGSSQTSASASRSGTNVNTNDSAKANQNVNAGKKANVNTNGSASQSASAGTGDLAIPSGTKVPAVLDKSVDSRKCKQGDEVIAKTTQDVMADGKVIIPKNSRLIGHVTQASAKANGESDSSLGIVFDKAMLRNGSTVPMQARIQALAAPVVSTASSMSDDMSMDGGSPTTTSARSSGGGGLGSAVGGATSTAGGAVNTVGNAAGGATSGVGSTVNSTTGATTGAVGNVAGNTTSATGALTSNSSGVIGLKNLQLNSDNSSSAAGSVITSTGKNVKLDSGSRMVLDVTGSSQTSQ
jgi:hypothetical protein